MNHGPLFPGKLTPRLLTTNMQNREFPVPLATERPGINPTGGEPDCFPADRNPFSAGKLDHWACDCMGCWTMFGKWTGKTPTNWAVFAGKPRNVDRSRYRGQRRWGDFSRSTCYLPEALDSPKQNRQRSALQKTTRRATATLTISLLSSWTILEIITFDHCCHCHTSHAETAGWVLKDRLRGEFRCTFFQNDSYTRITPAVLEPAAHLQSETTGLFVAMPHDQSKSQPGYQKPDIDKRRIQLAIDRTQPNDIRTWILQLRNKLAALYAESKKRSQTTTTDGNLKASPISKTTSKGFSMRILP
jgi:hypothetical protein